MQTHTGGLNNLHCSVPLETLLHCQVTNKINTTLANKLKALSLLQIDNLACVNDHYSSCIRNSASLVVHLEIPKAAG